MHLYAVAMASDRPCTRCSTFYLIFGLPIRCGHDKCKQLTNQTYPQNVLEWRERFETHGLYTSIHIWKFTLLPSNCSYHLLDPSTIPPWFWGQLQLLPLPRSFTLQQSGLRISHQRLCFIFTMATCTKLGNWRQCWCGYFDRSYDEMFDVGWMDLVWNFRFSPSIFFLIGMCDGFIGRMFEQFYIPPILLGGNWLKCLN